MSTVAAPAAIQFEGLTKTFISRDNKLVHAIHNVSFTVAEGEFVALVGPSGCGKTTTLNVLAGITDLTAGRAFIRGGPPEQSRFDIGYVFQQDTVLPWKRVTENIATGLLIRSVPKSQRHDKAMELVRRMGLDGFESAYPFELSGGMRKRVALATAMAYDPSILLMDEPFGALDAQTRMILQDELLRIWEADRKTVLFVTHDLAEAISLADRIIVMTARPARVKTQHIVDLPRPRSAADARLHPRFDELYSAIWDDLRPEIQMSQTMEAAHE
jgi:NitT/TauT family transport system ATP-binding protein